jgi:hypothetical protein
VKGIRFTLALWTGKAVQLVMRLLGREATYLPGKLALKLCPDFLHRIGKPELLVGVTGTNGKTTVTNMLCDLLAGFGEDPVSNRLGSNIDAGAASALLSAAGLNGRCRKRMGVLEMDERSAGRIFPALKPQYLIITNLFRDSMRRNAHPEYIASLLDKYIQPETKLILNADDPISSNVGKLNNRRFFRIDPLPFEPPVRENLVVDARLCPVCGEPIEYDFRRYNHIGRAHCAACGWTSPEPDYQLISADRETGVMTVLEEGVWHEYRMPADAVYNLYNAMAAISALRSMGYPYEQIAAGMEKLEVVQSRFWLEQIGRWELTEIMAKGLNAVACSRNFDYVLNAGGKKAVVLLLDDVFDEKSSSENIAWLYDADFEFLAGEDVVQVLAVGARCLDTRLRLLIAGVPEERITVVPKAKDAPAAVDLTGCEKVFVLYEVYRRAQAVSVRNGIGERMAKE